MINHYSVYSPFGLFLMAKREACYITRYIYPWSNEVHISLALLTAVFQALLVPTACEIHKMRPLSSL